MDLEMLIDQLREQASDVGLFFPMQYDTDALEAEGSLHSHKLSNRNVLLMQPGGDATAEGAPSDLTVQRYADAVKENAYSIVVLEPAAIEKDARDSEANLAFTNENEASFRALVEAVKAASLESHGFEPVIVLLLDHAGHHAQCDVEEEERPEHGEEGHRPRRFCGARREPRMDERRAHQQEDA